jgi:hypothetical protein
MNKALASVPSTAGGGREERKRKAKFGNFRFLLCLYPEQLHIDLVYTLDLDLRFNFKIRRVSYFPRSLKSTNLRNSLNISLLFPINILTCFAVWGKRFMQGSYFHYLVSALVKLFTLNSFT